MTFDEYFKITRFKNKKSFNRSSLLFVLLMVILLITFRPRFAGVHQEMVLIL